MGKNYRNTLSHYSLWRHALAAILDSLKKLAAFIVFIIILATATIVIFELLVSGLPVLSLQQVVGILLVFVFGLPVIYFLKSIKSLLTPRVGLQAATILQFVSQALAVMFMVFAILAIFHVELSTLLTSAGIISVTVGLIISTFVGGILSGALVFTTHHIKVGDDVMVNNVPGKVTEMTALVLRIRTDVGQITIPNSAVASGGVILTAIRKPEEGQERRLPYSLGDRVITPFRNEEGVVTELTEYHTTILLDSGREIKFLNNAVLIGGVVIARTRQNLPSN